MSKLITTPNLAKADDVYEHLIHAHDGLSKAESDAYNARLILILLNHIGDEGVIDEALLLATSGPQQKTGHRKAPGSL